MMTSKNSNMTSSDFSLFQIITSMVKKVRLALYIDHLILFHKIVLQIASFSKAKSKLPKVTSERIESWPKPDPRVFPSKKKLLWGFWNSGEENMPPFLKLCIESWRVNNPDWTVTILSDHNFKSYVAAEELPSTFYSLKVQHRSDIIRVAVLLRYGGIYMDASTMCLKGFDDLMDNKTTPELLLMPAYTLTNGIPFPNNAFIISREPNNPLLSAFLQRMVSYWENPAQTLDEMTNRPEFQRVFFTTRDPNQGVVGGTELYTANLLLLADVLWFEKTADYARDHVRYLSHYQWGTPDFRTNPIKGASKQDMSKINVFKFWSILGVLKAFVKSSIEDDEELARAVYDRICVMKFSSDIITDKDSTREQMLSMPTTYGRVLRKAMDANHIDQAKLEDMRYVDVFFV